MRLIRAFNNNVVLAEDEGGRETVVLGRGIGWNSTPGDRVDPDRIERQFYPEEHTTTTERLATFVANIPLDDIDLTLDVLQMASARLGSHINDRMLIALADHLSFVIRRSEDGMTLEYPLQWEVDHLYPDEAAVARDVLRLVMERTGISLPAGEASLLALHFVNARFTPGELSKTVQATQLLQQILVSVEQTFGFEVPESSVSVTRFVTHLRYLLVRAEQGLRFGDELPDLLATIRTAHPDEYACAQRIKMLLEVRLNLPINNDELLYLALHVARLVADHRATTTS